VDQRVAMTLNEWAWAHPAWRYFVEAIARWGILLLPAAVAAGALWPRRGAATSRRAALAAALAVVVAGLSALALGAFIERPRPFVAMPLSPLFPHAANSSFPSDHTLLGVAMAGPLLWYVPRVGVWLVLWALVVGLARVVGGVHYLSDVLGSAALATMPVAVGVLAGEWLLRVLPPPILAPLGFQRRGIGRSRSNG